MILVMTMVVMIRIIISITDNIAGYESVIEGKGLKRKRVKVCFLMTYMCSTMTGIFDI